jgi:predicted PurR-regulated permease PerM
LPNYLNQPIEARLLDALPTLPDSVSQLFLEVAKTAKGYIETIASGFFGATTSLFGGALSFFMVFILSFYLSVQEKGIENFLRIILPIQYEEYAVDLWFRTREKLGAWMKGQLILGLMVGILVFLCLSILRIKYALILAFLAAVFEIIPVFGPVLSAIPAVAMAALQSPTLALITAGVYFIIQQFENHLIYPLVIRKMVGVPPIISILALIIGAKLGGFMGILLSMPIVTILVEISNDFEKKKRPATDIAVDVSES